MNPLVWCLVVLLLPLHQAPWFWDDASLLFGFLPVGLFYHVCLSLACAITWLLATQLAWPHELEHSVAIRSSDGPATATPATRGQNEGEAGA